MEKILSILTKAKLELVERRKELAEKLDNNKDAENSLLEEWTNEKSFCRKSANEIDILIKTYEARKRKKGL